MLEMLSMMLFIMLRILSIKHALPILRMLPMKHVYDAVCDAVYAACPIYAAYFVYKVCPVYAAYTVYEVCL